MLGDSIGFEEISVDVGVVSLNPAVYNPSVGDPAAKAFITAESGAMRYRLDGQDPTDITGHPLLDSDFLELKSIYFQNIIISVTPFIFIEQIVILLKFILNL